MTNFVFVEGEKTGMKITLEASEKVLQENREENRRLREEVNVLKQRLNEVTETNQNLNNKLEAAENNTIGLERQLLDLNLLQSNHRDSNRQDVLLGGIKVCKLIVDILTFQILLFFLFIMNCIPHYLGKI